MIFFELLTVFATISFGLSIPTGCPNPTTCRDTEYGCCPDGVSPAGGSQNQGCPVPDCKLTLYGCCESDNKTPAEGIDQEGCPPPCLASLYGCCADNETQATGPRMAGCPETSTTTTEPRNGCEGNILCDQLFNQPSGEVGKSVGRNESEHLHRLQRSIDGRDLCETETKELPPFLIDAPEELSSVQREYFSKGVNQTYCKNEGLSCLGESGISSIVCKTHETTTFVTARIGNETVSAKTTVKAGCICIYA